MHGIADVSRLNTCQPAQIQRLREVEVQHSCPSKADSAISLFLREGSREREREIYFDGQFCSGNGVGGPIKRNPRTRSATDFLRQRTEQFSYERPLSFFSKVLLALGSGHWTLCGRIGSRG